jgi:hypothetical protein
MEMTAKTETVTAAVDSTTMSGGEFAKAFPRLVAALTVGTVIYGQGRIYYALTNGPIVRGEYHMSRPDDVFEPFGSAGLESKIEKILTSMQVDGDSFRDAVRAVYGAPVSR